MQKEIRVGASGVGGGCGQGILKALAMAVIHDHKVIIHPADIQPLAPGIYRFQERGVVLPPPEGNFSPWLNWIKEQRIRFLFPGSDHDLAPFAAHAEEAWKSAGCTIVVSNAKSVDMANDKMKTAEALEQAGLPYLKTFDGLPEGTRFTRWHVNLSRHWPLVVKPKFGMTSRGVNFAADIEELMFYHKRTPSPVIQEFTEGDEYTCSICFDKYNEGRAIFIMRRHLYAGTTYVAEPVNHPALEAFLRDAWLKLRTAGYKFFGGVNFQLRESNGQFYIFEINARSSGSTAIRSHFGYNEPQLMIQHMLRKVPINQPRTRTGVALRYWDELYLMNTSIDEITHRKAGMKGIIPSWL